MYDVIVIGGGPGGYAAGIRASQLGGKVALIESSEIGGTCVNRGCIPAKIWHRAAFLKDAITRAQEFGLKATLNETDLSAIVTRKRGVSLDIRTGMAGLLSNNNIEVIEGFAALENPREVKVGERILEAKKLVIATGASPVIPEISGLQEGLMTTDDLFDMDHLPDSVLVYGAGHVEVETAALLNTFGVKVYLAFNSARILPREDGDTSQRIAKALRERGVEILSRSTLRSVHVSSHTCNALLSADDDRTVSVERVLVSLREPNTKDVGLEKAGVKLDESGFILVNESLQTSAEGIYAVGDVTGGRMLSYAATSMGVTAGENAMGKRSIFPAHLVPRGLYTIPEASAVGLSEEEAEARGYDVETGLFPMSINGLALSYGEMEGVVKVVCDSAYGEILGVHIIGGRATELIWGAGLAMQLEATADDLARMILVHPTFSESLAMAAQDAQGWALYLPKR